MIKSSKRKFLWYDCCNFLKLTQFFYSINKCTHALGGVKSVWKHPVSWNTKYDESHYFTLLMYYFERAWVYFETNKIERGLSFLWHLPWEILTLCYFWGTIRPSPTNQFLRSSLFLLFGLLDCLVRSLTFFFSFYPNVHCQWLLMLRTIWSLWHSIRQTATKRIRPLPLKAKSRSKESVLQIRQDHWWKKSLTMFWSVYNRSVNHIDT